MAARPKPYVRVAVLLAVVAALAVGLLLSPSLRAQVRGSVSREPTFFTELYFDDYAIVPKVLVVGRPNLVQFTIANHEKGAVTYHFGLIADGPGGARQVDDGQVRVDRGATGTATARFSPVASGASWILRVQLVDRPESIHFAATS